MRNKILEKEIRKKWPPRALQSHKGQFGRILILAGSTGMSGAAALTGMAALRTGAGLVTIQCPDSIYEITARQYPELMVYPLASTPQGTLAFRNLKRILECVKNQDVLIIGPGLSRHSETSHLVRVVSQRTALPLILDADGLTAFAQLVSVWKSLKGRSVLTPHPGEFKRLFPRMKLSDTETSRTQCALLAAKKLESILVLKGYHTVISNGVKTLINTTGNPGMATAGSGDVLAGVVAAMAGQGFSLWESACFGTYLHGLAGDAACQKSGEASLVASDILEMLPRVIRKVRIMQ